MCKCKRGEGVKKEDHTCTMLNNTESKHYWERSKRYWEDRQGQVRNGMLKSYDLSTHMDWVDKSNYGILHFGIHPQFLNRENICYDTFHMKCAITRCLMNFLRSFAQNFMTVETHLLFLKELGNFWNEYHTTVWDTNRSFASFKGNELALFVANIGPVVSFLQRKVSKTNLRDNVKESLELWNKMFKVLGITYITDGSEYLEQVDKYEEQVKRLYKLGGESFLSRKSSAEKDKGQSETFYFHVLRYYILPQIMKDTFEKHCLGVGIFTMQGFEQQNKESKTKMTRNSNFKGSTIRANLEKLWTKFYHTSNTEIKKKAAALKKEKNKKKRQNNKNNNSDTNNVSSSSNSSNSRNR